MFPSLNILAIDGRVWLVGLVMVAGLVTTPMRAASLLLDFGPTTVSSDALTNSPGHATGAVSASETTWNKVTGADVGSGLLYGNGSGASGVSLNLGLETTIGNNILDFAAANDFKDLTGTRAAQLGLDYSNAAGTNAAAAKDGLFRNGTSNGSQSAAIGLRIDGLAVGMYTIYLVGRNTNATAAAGTVFYASVGATANTFNFSSLAGAVLSNAFTESNDAWIAGNQYNTRTVTITEAGQSMYIAVEGYSVDYRGFMNSVEIVSVPEPSVGVLLAGSAGALVIAGTRRRRNVKGPGLEW